MIIIIIMMIIIMMIIIIIIIAARPQEPEPAGAGDRHPEAGKSPSLSPGDRLSVTKMNI